MAKETLINLIQDERYTELDQKLRRKGIPQRMEAIKELISNPEFPRTRSTSLYFEERLNVEVGALIMARQDVDQATKIYRVLRKNEKELSEK